MVPASDAPSPQSQGKDISIPLGKANLLSIPIFIGAMASVFGPYWLIWGEASLLASFGRFFRPASFIPTFLIGIVVHEMLHAIGWSLFGRKPMGVIKFGFQVKTVTPYAHSTVPLRAAAYCAGAALPAIVMGGLPAIAGISLGQGWLAMFGGFFLAAASGDYLVLWTLRTVPHDALVVDHPTNAGCIVVTSETGDTLPVPPSRK